MWTFPGSHEQPGAALAGLQDIMALDPGAFWDAGARAVRGSCAPGCGPYSPRIVALALYNSARNAGEQIYIRDFMSAFVSSIDAGGVAHVFITRGIGKMASGLAPLANAGFLNVVAVAR